MDSLANINEDQKTDEIWYAYPTYTTPHMTHAAHPVTTEVPPGYNGMITWLKGSHVTEEWCDLTKVVKAREKRTNSCCQAFRPCRVLQKRHTQGSGDWCGVLFGDHGVIFVKENLAVVMYCFARCYDAI